MSNFSSTQKKKVASWEQIEMTLTLNNEVAEDLRRRVAEHQQTLPNTTIESLCSWAVRYYLQHAYKEPDPFEEEVRRRIDEERMDYEDDPGLYEGILAERRARREVHL